MAHLNICPAIQGSLDEFANSIYAQRGNYGFLQALTSEINGGAVRINDRIVSGDMGVSYTHDFQMKSTVLSDPAIAVTVGETDCVTGGTAYTHTATSVTRSVFEEQFKIPYEDLKNICGDYNVELARHVTKAIDNLCSRMNMALLTSAGALIGSYASTVTTLGGPTVQNVDLISGVPLAPNLPDYMQLAENLNESLAPVPILVGGGDLSILSRHLNVGCCSDAGVDFSAVAGQFYYFKDVRVTSLVPPLVGTQTFLALRPDTVKYVYSNKFPSTPRIEDSMTKTQVFDPYSNLIFDLQTFFKADCDEYWFKLSLSGGLFVPPTVFAAGDIYNGINGLYKIQNT